MLSDEDVLSKFDALRAWSRDGDRAPHKPLLILLLLARIQSKGEHRVSFPEIEKPLTQLLRDFGPPRTSYHPEYPFWRLQNDGVWEVDNPQRLVTLRGNRVHQGDIPRSILRDEATLGGLPLELAEPLRERPELLNALVSRLLDAHFPETLHEDLLDALGFQWVAVPRARVLSSRLERDAAFRTLILDIYDQRCAVCGYDGALLRASGARSLLGIEAAHIRWHAAHGADEAENGLALCSLHHTMLDKGALGLNTQLEIQVSRWVVPGPGLDEWLFRFEGRALRAPRVGYPLPADPNIQWHRKQVFRAGSPPPG